DRLEQPPDDHHRRHHGGNRHRRDHERHLVAIAVEGHHHLARPVGEPGEAEADREDHGEIEEDAQHRSPYALSAAASALSTSWSAVCRARTLAMKSAPAALGSSGSVSYSASALS